MVGGARECFFQGPLKGEPVNWGWVADKTPAKICRVSVPGSLRESFGEG